MDPLEVSELQQKYPFVDSALILALAVDGAADDDNKPRNDLETLLNQLNEEAQVLESLGEVQGTVREREELQAVLNDLEEEQESVAESASNLSSLGSLGSVVSLSTDLESLNLDETFGETWKQNILFLRQSFPGVPLAVIKAKLQSSKGDVVKATDLLLNSEVLDQIEPEAYYASYGKKKARIRRRDKKIAQDNVQLQVLAEVLGISIEEAARKYEDNDKSVMKILAEGLPSTNGNLLSKNVWSSSPSPAASTRPSTGGSSGSSKVMIVPSSRPNSPPVRPLLAPLPLQNNRQLQDMAVQQYQMGQDSLSKAREMYRKVKSNPLYGGAVSYYTETGKGHIQLSRAAHEAIEHQSLQRNSSPYTMDFHGVSTKVALEACVAKLEDWWTREQYRRITPLKLITGAGRHSEGGVPKIKNAIRKILKDNGWKYEEDGSFFLVKGVR